MKELKSDDIYVFTFYDEAENELGTGVVESLEEFEVINKSVKILTWINIVGQNMEIGEINTHRVLELAKTDE